jgi:serine/threonine protein kinase
MRALVAHDRDRVCRRCHAKIIRAHSYGGYCPRCLFQPALASPELPQQANDGHFHPYKILTNADGSLIELGRGSMGITYRAVDTNLEFSVALKVIHFKVATTERSWDGFMREAQAAARLRHPHIVSVLHYGAAHDGRCFYAMDLVDGETLAGRVTRTGPLPVADALEVVAQVASALWAIEKTGLVHRDLKPSNLMLVSGSEIDVKLIDFGLTWSMGNAAPTKDIIPDGFAGTPAFASPEQLLGNQLDQRSDYFSLGCTLFYLLTASPPFENGPAGRSPGPIRRQGQPLAKLDASGIPLPVQGLLRSLLSPTTAGRPRNGEALAEAILKCRLSLERAKSARKKPLRFWIGAALIGLGLTTFTLIFENLCDSSQKSIAVLPFNNLSPLKADAYFADGVQTEVLTNLGKVADLQVISQHSVQAYRDSANRPPPQEIGRVLQVRYLLEGSVQREGKRVRVTAQLEDAKTGREVWAERYDGQLEDIFSIQTELAEAVLYELRARFLPGEKASLERKPTGDLLAYELYLRANALMVNYYEEVQGWDPLYNAERLLKDAVARDAGFALAWRRLAEVDDELYWENADRSEGRKQAAENALEKASRLPADDGEIHLARGVHLLMTTNDYLAVRRECELARPTLPNSASLFSLLAGVEGLQGRWQDALLNLEKASILNPKDLNLVMRRCEIYSYHRQYDKIRGLFTQLRALETNRPAIAFERALVACAETGDKSALNAFLDGPDASQEGNGVATFLRIANALADRDYTKAEKVLAADPKPDFEVEEKQFLSRDFLLGWIKRSEHDNAAAKIAYANARPLQLEYMTRWPDDPNPVMVLAITDAALGRREDALREAHAAMNLPLAQDAVHEPVLAVDLAQVYLWTGERDLAMKQLEDLVQIPRALAYGDLVNSRDWDDFRSDPRFQKLLSQLKPLPIVNRSEIHDSIAAGNL